MMKIVFAAAASVLMTAAALAQTSPQPQPEQSSYRGYQCNKASGATS